MRNIKGQFQKEYFYDRETVEKNNTFKYYLIGLLAADGNVHNKRVTLSQSHDHGKKLLKFVLNNLKSNHKLYHNKKTNSYSFTIFDEWLVNYLQEYNITENKTYKYQLPNIDMNYLPYFLQGYIEGDGSIGIYDNGNGVKYLCLNFVGTKDFIDKISNLVKIKHNITHIKRCENLYEIRFNGKFAVEFCKFVYEDIIVETNKVNTFYKFLTSNYGEKYMKYYDVKPIIINELKLGKSVLELSKIFKVPYKTIHTWKSRY